MPSRKRAVDEMEAEEPVEEPSTLHKLRDMWQFANLMQYISMFGDAIKFDSDFDIEDLETECLKPQPSEKLSQLGLALLKHVSSHKGLTPAIFDEYTRRQYEAKAPRANPFGTDEVPGKFDDFDIFTKIKVLQQLSQWTLINPNSIRERMVKQGDDQTEWRMEPLGWDAEDRVLYVLDDNRLYRRTDPPPPPPPPRAKSKSKAKKKSKGTRSSKRQKLEVSEPEDVPDEVEDTVMQGTEEPEDDGFGGMKWECLCITLEEYQSYINSLRKTRDENEKVLRSRLEKDVLPVIEKLAEEQAKKEARRQKEWENLQKLATAKRSSRISSRLEKQKEAEEAVEAERKRREELALAKAEEKKRMKLEEARESRMMTREQRLKERETKRILHEEELRRLQEESEKVEQHEARISERHLKAEMKRRQEELERLQEEEDDWVLDCEVCGMYGEKLKDGTDIIACDKCTVWQHIKCHGITQAQADDANFQFICESCTRKEEDAKQPKLPPLKFRLTSQSPKAIPNGSSQTNGTASNGHNQRLEAVAIPVQQPVPEPMPPAQHTQNWMSGPSLSPRGQALGPPGIQRSEAAYGSPFDRVNGNLSSNVAPPAFARPSSSERSGGAAFANGFPASSPPQLQNPRGATATPYNGYALPRPPSNGNPFNAPHPFNTSQNLPPYNNSFNRPTSSAGMGSSFGSPVKHSPAPSPQPSNGYSQHPLINSPHSSFPQPNATPRPSYSPVKHSSPAPTNPNMSSPVPTPRIAPSPSQLPAQMLPHPIPAPEKHDGLRPLSSHSMSETPVLPPIKSLSPNALPQILSPPTKKASPTPDRQQFAPVSGNGFGGAQQ